MDPRDEIDFDFFEDEPATTEATAPRPRLPRRGGQGTGMRRPPGPPRGYTPILRLAGVVGAAIVALTFFGLLVQSCGTTSTHDQYASYMDKVDAIAHGSATDGQSLATALNTADVKVPQLASKLDDIAQLEQQNLNAAEALDPPGPLRMQNIQLVDALQLRVNGTHGLADAFRKTASSKSSDDADTLLQQADRLLAGDVVYDDLFATPVGEVMKAHGVVGVTVPPSEYVTTSQFSSANYWSLVLERLRGNTGTSGSSTTSGSTSSSTGLHGTNLVSVVAQPGNHTLSPTGLNTVTATTNLTFDVTVHDGGDSQEVQIPVTLTIDKPHGAIVVNRTISVINPGADVTLHFPITQAVTFAEKTQLKVNVAPVPHEANVNNNSGVYQVIFSFG